MAKIIERIRKVLAKAEGTDNAAEAEMLMAKVNQMLEEHNFSMLDLATLETDDPIGTTKKTSKFRNNDGWMRVLAAQVAQYYGCQAIIGYDPYTKHTKYIHITGRESNRVTFEVMMPYIKAQVVKAGRMLHRDEPHRYTSERMGARHVANALSFRIARMIREKEAQEKSRVATGQRALVPVDMIKRQMQVDFPSLRDSRATSLSTSGKAREAAQGISLHRQTGKPSGAASAALLN